MCAKHYTVTYLKKKRILKTEDFTSQILSKCPSENLLSELLFRYINKYQKTFRSLCPISPLIAKTGVNLKNPRNAQ